MNSMALSQNMIIKEQTSRQRIKLMKNLPIMLLYMGLVSRTCLSTKKVESRLNMSRTV